MTEALYSAPVFSSKGPSCPNLPSPITHPAFCSKAHLLHGKQGNTLTSCLAA
jgi:hypothetical protein